MFFFQSKNNLTSLSKYKKDDVLFSVSNKLYINGKLLRRFDNDIIGICLSKNFIIIACYISTSRSYTWYYIDKDTYYEYDMWKKYNISNDYNILAYVNDNLFSSNIFVVKIQEDKNHKYIDGSEERYFCKSKYRWSKTNKLSYKNTKVPRNDYDGEIIYGNLYYHRKYYKDFLIFYKRKNVDNPGIINHLTQYKIMKNEKINIFF